MECEIAWDLRFTQTADWARRYEPSASECKSQCKGGTRVHVDKIRCFIHLGTLLADFTTILAGDNRFPKVTRGFQQTFTPSSFPQVTPYTKRYNTNAIRLQYNTIQYFLHSSSYTMQYLSSCYQAAPPGSAPYPWENFPSSQSMSPRIPCYSKLHFANDLVSGFVVFVP